MAGRIGYANHPSMDLYLQDISRFEPLSGPEEQGLGGLIREKNQDAIDTMVNANLRFVVSIAKEYEGQGIPLGDLVGYGNIGLITAATRYDSERGNKFITYAVWWIRQGIHQGMANYNRTVRLPMNRVDMLDKAKKVHTLLSHVYGVPPSTEEVADEIEASHDLLTETLSLAQPTTSLDAPFDPDEEGSDRLQEMLADPEILDPSEIMVVDERREDLRKALRTLEPMEEHVLRQYFGLDGEEPKTYQQIGNGIERTRERVRQIKEEGLRKLRHPTRQRYVAGHR